MIEKANGSNSRSSECNSTTMIRKLDSSSVGRVQEHLVLTAFDIHLQQQIAAGNPADICASSRRAS